MQLSSRILTALAVLILAVAVVAVRAGSPGMVEAATGTIDVLNVGTCYATDGEVFGASDCDAGDEAEDYEVTGRDDVSEVATVFATYSHDPKTAPDNPRAVLENSNLIKISIADPGRDKRTPVLLPAGDAPAANDQMIVSAMHVYSLVRTMMKPRPMRAATWRLSKGPIPTLMALQNHRCHGR